MIRWAVTGHKNGGKTGLVERLVAELTARGLAVSTLKHAHHAVDVDQPGRDSHRHRAAGARQTILAGADRWALMTELRGTPEPDLDALAAKLDPVDVVLAEGWKASDWPKIEAHRAATGKPPLALDNPTIRALASDAEQEAPCPRFHLDDTAVLADFLLEQGR